MTAPKWRIAAGLLVVAALVLFGVTLIPLYYRNYQFQQFVSAATQRVENHTKSDDLLREWLLDKAAALDLPVKAGNVQIRRSPDGLRIDVLYLVRVDLWVYTVNLHFHPGAGS